MTQPEPTPHPIVVRDSPAKEISASTLRVFLLGAFAFGLGQFVKSEMVMAAIIPAATVVAGFVATYIVGLQKLISNHRKLRTLARAAPDEIAVVRK